jgi:hypothetical protein
MMLKRTGCLLGSLLVGVIVAAAVVPALANQQVEEGKIYRLILTNNKEIIGTLTEEGDAYKVQVAYGITQTIKKSQVRSLIAFDESMETGGSGDPRRRKITDEEIQAILGDESVEDLYVWDYVKPIDLMETLPTNPDNLEWMKRVAGRQARVHETEHFVLVYTASIGKTKRLAARFEAVYKWRVWFLERMGVQPIRPEYRFETFFFGTHEEFQNYSAVYGNISDALGFWHPFDNRSAYFDIETWPAIARLLERYSNPDVDLQIRRRGRNMLERWVEHYNMEVVQHEAGHHIDFNIGFFPPRADVPRWLPEGLTMQFEVAPSRMGGSFGKVNYARLNELRQQYGPELQALPMLRDFMLHQAVWFQGYNYPLGWALVHYLIREYPDELPEFMQIMAQREDDWGVLVPLSVKLQQMEDLFGKIDEEWTQRFKDYINSIPMRQSELPPALADLP